jgi:tRNA G18 (ribose-2'-O)-methylase SpoU
VVWLLAHPVYPGNVGFAIRTAEVSGADGIYVDCDFDHAARREATRAAMRADRFMPVGWERSGAVLAAARAAGKRVVAIEDVGTRAPWQADLTGPLLLLVGAEAEGVPEALLASADDTLRIPMAGFIASYNLQAAVAAVAAERFRQLEARCP